MKFAVGDEVLYDSWVYAIVVGYSDGLYELHFPECYNNKGLVANRLVDESMIKFYYKED